MVTRLHGIAFVGKRRRQLFERESMRSEYIVRHPDTSIIQLRQEWFREYQALGNVRETCARFGISRKTFYKWLKRFKNSGGNPSSLADLPRTPHHSPRRTSDGIRALVLELRQSTGFGPRRLGRELREEKGVQLSERTIWKIIRSGSPVVENLDNVQPEFSPAALNRVSVGV